MTVTKDPSVTVVAEYAFVCMLCSRSNGTIYKKNDRWHLAKSPHVPGEIRQHKGSYFCGHCDGKLEVQEPDLSDFLGQFSTRRRTEDITPRRGRPPKIRAPEASS